MIEPIREASASRMPPHPWLYQGIDEVLPLMARAFGADSMGDWRLETRANRLPAAASYLRRPGDTECRAFKLDVLRVRGRRRSPRSPTALITFLALAPAAQASVNPPAGHVPFDAGFAVGVQAYKCDGAASILAGPRATVYSLHGKIDHYGGPTWEARDGSKVVGAKVSEEASPIGAIPHLLLRAASTTPGRLSKTSFVQRLATTGGVAPAASTCTTVTSGKVAEVPYTAVYTFWRALR